MRGPGPGSGGRDGDHSWEKISSGEFSHCDHHGGGLVEEYTGGADSLSDCRPLPGIQPDVVLSSLTVLDQPELQQRQPVLQGLPGRVLHLNLHVED